MIQIQNIGLPPKADEAALRQKAAKKLGIEETDIKGFHILRQSIDARKRTQLLYVYTVGVDAENEETLVLRAESAQISLYLPREDYVFPKATQVQGEKPVIVGMGPAGLFAALFLARAGVPCIVLERGRSVDERGADVENFWKTGELSRASNVQFGEGGAGTFSDGKLTSGIRDPRARVVMETLVAHGAPEDILYAHKPHVGTDVLRQVVKSIRAELISLGCDIRFENQLYDLKTEGGKLRAITVMGEQGAYELPCKSLILAPGHSARDTFAMLQMRAVSMEQKPFAIGVRIEHKQEDISRAQFGDGYTDLPPTDYKLACHLPNGRSVFTFCVCPGGEVVAASSDAEQVVTNGMSNHAREHENINGGFLVSVTPEDYPGEDPLAGVRFQQYLEKAAWTLGGENFHAPAQLVSDFLQDKPSEEEGSVKPSYRPGVRWTNLSDCLPSYITESLRLALPIFDRKVRGFAKGDAVMMGIETRSSSPLRILRDKDSMRSPLEGLYPCGEGAGYAGGIVSAAADGIRIAEAVARG